MADERVSLEYDLTDIPKQAKVAEQALERLADANDDVAASAKRAESASKDAARAQVDQGRATMNAAQSFQDFAQGGFGGILNNIPKLVEDAASHIPVVGKIAEAFGGPIGLAAKVTAVGVAAYVAAPLIKGLWDTFTTGPEKIPEAADAVGKLGGRLKETRDRLDEVKEAWKGTATELAAHNKLTAEAADLEKKLGEATKARSAIDAQREKEKASPESAKAFGDAVKERGGIDKVTSDLAAAMPGATSAAQAQLDQMKREQDAELATAASPNVKASINARYRPQVEAAQAAVEKARADARAQAEALASKGLGGDQAAIRRIDAALPGQGWDRATTEAVAQQKEALEAGKEQAKRDAEWQEKQAKERAKARADREKKEADDNKLVDSLNAQGRDVERDWRADQEREAEREKEAAAREEKERPEKERRALMERARNAEFVQEGRERANLQNFAAQQGVDIPSDQLGPVLGSMKQFMASGASPMEAAAAAMADFLSANAGTMQRMQALEAQFRQMQGIARQQQQINGTMLSRGNGDEALAIARGVRAEFDQFMGNGRQDMQVSRGRLPRNRRMEPLEAAAISRGEFDFFAARLRQMQQTAPSTIPRTW